MRNKSRIHFRWKPKYRRASYHHSYDYRITKLDGLTSLVAQMVQHLPTMWETWVNPWVGKVSWRRKWQPTPVFLPGKFHGHSPQGRKELDTTERLHFTLVKMNLFSGLAVSETLRLNERKAFPRSDQLGFNEDWTYIPALCSTMMWHILMSFLSPPYVHHNNWFISLPVIINDTSFICKC